MQVGLVFLWKSAWKKKMNRMGEREGLKKKMNRKGERERAWKSFLGNHKYHVPMMVGFNNYIMVFN
jgi:hypothetical protein